MKWINSLFKNKSSNSFKSALCALRSVICALLIINCSLPALGAGNVPVDGPVGDFGVWATDHNQKLFVKNLTDDISDFQNSFQTKVLVNDYVPIEAKVGRAFIGAMNGVGQVLERSLVRFMTIFIIILFAFWTMLESYQTIRGEKEAKALWEDVVKKLVVISIWIWIIEQGPAQLFMWIMGPVISIGTYMSDLILNSVAATAGASLPDTCASIHAYVDAHTTGSAIIDARQTADLLCVPTRLSGFFYTAVAAGWQWMLAGIGRSAFTFIAGAVFVVIFIYNIWKFALMALGVIADLFLTVFMLPFTALHQTFGGKSDGKGGAFGAPLDAFGGGSGSTSYKGIAGQIFNGFLKLFETESLSTQIQKFIQAAIYFVSLSIVIALCAAILSGVIDADLAATVPTLENDGFMITLIVGCLVAYLANQAGEIAKNFGGAVGNGLPNLEGDIKKLAGNTAKTAKDWWKMIRKK
ncbi:MAG: hypothetical protein LBJ73_04750 [Rickettsiales bacterium]|jgi:hypothetical protein|nr:hypothetical protein [Rickettsiales bacterium]